MCLFRVSFLTILDIYKAYFKSLHYGYRYQGTYFLCEKLLRLYAIGFCHQVLPNLHCWWSEQLCNQQQPFKLLELVMYWDLCKGLVTDCRFVHQGKEGHYKVKSNWILEWKFNYRLIFWDRLEKLVKLLILVTIWLLISGFLGVVTLKLPGGVFVLRVVFSIC